MQTEELTLQQGEPSDIPGQPLNVLYALNSTDGILIPCKTAKGERAYIPMGLLLALLEKQIACRLRMAGGRIERA